MKTMQKNKTPEPAKVQTPLTQTQIHDIPALMQCETQFILEYCNQFIDEFSPDQKALIYKEAQFKISTQIKLFRLLQNDNPAWQEDQTYWNKNILDRLEILDTIFINADIKQR